MSDHSLDLDGIFDWIRRCPHEIRRSIWEMVLNFVPQHTHLARMLSQYQQQLASMPDTQNPDVPPRNGTSPFMDRLPLDARRRILSEFLPKKDITIHPSIGKGNPESRTCDLLILSKQLCKELSVVLYEERTFAVHIYEGVFSGGAEFLNSGPQRLQYKDSFKSSEFKRFENGEFSFHRVKRLHVIIHPSTDKKDKSNRHDPMLTYFMVITLMSLLKGDNFKALTYLKVEFSEEKANKSGNHDTQHYYGTQYDYSNHVPNYWWSGTLDAPRTTSVHGISNVELILLAFLHIHKVHTFDVVLPHQFTNDTKTQRIITHARQQLDPRLNLPDPYDDDLEHKLDVSRDALNDWIFETMFGKGNVPAKDLWISLDEFATEDSDNEGDGRGDGGGRGGPATKRAKVSDMFEVERTISNMSDNGPAPRRPQASDMFQVDRTNDGPTPRQPRASDMFQVGHTPNDPSIQMARIYAQTPRHGNSQDMWDYPPGAERYRDFAVLQAHANSLRDGTWFNPYMVWRRQCAEALRAANGGV